MVELLDSWIRAVGPFAYFVLAVAAALEYVVPPFPGDTVVLLGGVYAVRGEKSWLLVFLVIIAGSVVGAAVNYFIGRWLDVKVEHRLERKAILGMSLDQLLTVEARMRKRGGWLLLFNRFIPGVRGLLFVAAGMSNMPLPRVLGLGAISAAAHTAVVLGVGMALGGNVERIEAVAARYQSLALWILAGGVALFAARLLFRRWRRAVKSA